MVTMLGMSFGGLLGGTMIVETVFSWNGIGQVCTTAISARDYSLIQGYTMWMGFIYVIVNLLVYISYSFIDPRIEGGCRRNEKKNESGHEKSMGPFWSTVPVCFDFWCFLRCLPVSLHPLIRWRVIMRIC